MKFSVLCAFLIARASADRGAETQLFDDLPEPVEVNRHNINDLERMAAKATPLKSQAPLTDRRNLAGHSGHSCTIKELDYDYLAERYGLNMTNPDHIDALMAAVEGELQLGSITANIAEGNDAIRVGAIVEDGASGDEYFPYGVIKPLITVGEVNMCEENHGDVYVGVPDGMGAYLVDDDTLRLVVQSESYGPLYYESYPYYVNQHERRNLGVGGGNDKGASFTGSHVQYTDFDREGLTEFLTHDGAASEIIKGFGQVAHTYYNLAGDLVGPRSEDGPTTEGAHYSNTDADGNYVVANGVPTEADWLMQSLCSSHLEEKHQWGDGLGFEDDIYITNEEWITYDENATAFVGISAHAIDLKNGVDYAVGAVTVSGFEKIVEINPQHKDYVILSLSGYNGAYNNPGAEIDARNVEYNGTRSDGEDWVNPNNVCPARIYVGMKGKMEDGSDAPDDDFLARNGLRYGKVYGFAVDMEPSGHTQGQWRDSYHKCRDNGSKVDGKFIAIEWQWDGTVKNFRHDGAWDFQTQVPGYEGTRWYWWNGAGYSKGGSKTEHNSPDTRPETTAFIQGSTAGYFGHYYVHDVEDVLNDFEGGFPSEFDASYYVYQGENDISGQIHLGDEGLYNNDVPECFNLNDASMNCDADYSVKHTFEDIDGLEVIAASDGLYAIIQEDSGNDLGERMFITSPLEHDDDGMEIEYYFMAQSGGKFNTRMANGVGIPAGVNAEGNSHEFSGVIDLSGMLSKKGKRRNVMEETMVKKGGSKNGPSEDMLTYDFVINAGDGAAKREEELEISINDKLIMLGLQAHNFKSGVIEAFKADRGGQVLLYQPDI